MRRRPFLDFFCALGWWLTAGLKPHLVEVDMCCCKDVDVETETQDVEPTNYRKAALDTLKELAEDRTLAPGERTAAAKALLDWA